MNKLAFSLGDAFLGPGTHYLKQLTGVGSLASVLLSNAIVIAGIVLIFLIVISGIKIISGSGDPQKVADARLIITSGIIGFILVVSAYFIVRLVESSLGISILGGTGGTAFTCTNPPPSGCPPNFHPVCIANNTWSCQPN